jgi:hypothetical protein
MKKNLYKLCFVFGFIVNLNKLSAIDETLMPDTIKTLLVICLKMQF